MNSENTDNKLKQNLSKTIFDNLKTDYFLQILFNNLLKKKSLDIIKYNKNIKDRINISITDYKEYSEIFSSIELEIIPVNNIYNNFININEGNKMYIHIYFSDNKDEIKRNYLEENEQIKIIKIIIDYPVKSFENLFLCCKCIESIKFKKFYRNNITTMGHMFCGCSLLKELNFTNFNTNNVTNMIGMFQQCSSLKELNLSNFNTNNVINMRCMFYGCSTLNELNLSNFNTDNVTDMESMFSLCSSLKELNLSNFNTNKVTNMGSMFSGCSDKFQMEIKSQYKNINEEAFDKNLNKKI